MKKSILSLSVIATLATSSFAVTDAKILEQLDVLMKQNAALEAKLEKLSKKVNSTNKKLKRVSTTASTAKSLANGNHLKFNVDFRSSVDNINYKMADGSKASNDAFLATRLWLGAKYQASDNVIFFSTFSYNKAYGDSANHSQANTNPGYANFDWVTNENALDNSLKVKEAFFLYKNDTFMGLEMPWTASIGRRPSTGGLGANFREDDSRKSALAHVVNVEFDGASFRWNLDGYLPALEGSSIKFCAGRGLTNAKARFQQDGTDYSTDTTKENNLDMLGVILVPYDNGQYSVHTQYSKAFDTIGFDANPTTGQPDSAAGFKSQGDLDLATVMFKAEGIGDEVNDFLDDTIFFASYAMSKTNPKTGHAMLGSTDSKTGNSYWLGLQTPGMLTKKGKLGLEWNHGDKYWRSVTYAEDTMIGSKVAARGTALEAYYTQPLTKALSAQIRYTHINYDYSGSNAFFGTGGTPMSIDEAVAAGMGSQVVKEATDIRAYIRYRY
ncbi:MAG: DUF3373 family protein [Helicobacteraceae bacterium]|nr:DUF3373 family protein [Helicobacteraceae bacterium]